MLHSNDRLARAAEYRLATTTAMVARFANVGFKRDLPEFSGVISGISRNRMTHPAATATELQDLVPHGA